MPLQQEQQQQQAQKQSQQPQQQKKQQQPQVAKQLYSELLLERHRQKELTYGLQDEYKAMRTRKMTWRVKLGILVGAMPVCFYLFWGLKFAEQFCPQDTSAALTSNTAEEEQGRYVIQIRDSGSYVCFTHPERALCPPLKSMAPAVALLCKEPGFDEFQRYVFGSERESFGRHERNFRPFELVEDVTRRGGTLVAIGGGPELLTLPVFTQDQHQGRVYVFEPDPDELMKLHKHFAHVPSLRINIQGYGLAPVDTAVTFNTSFTEQVVQWDGSRKEVTKWTNDMRRFQLYNIRDKMPELFGQQQLAGILINCKGCEYDLVESILEETPCGQRRQRALVDRFQYIIVHFHRDHHLDVGVDAVREHCRLTHLLQARGFCPVYSFNFVWEAWAHPDLCV